jgi:hypothetical protein
MGRRALWLVAPVFAGCVPSGAITAKCSQLSLADVADPRSCEIESETFEKAGSLTFKVTTYRLLAKAHLTLSVGEGGVQVELVDAEGTTREATVTPQAPLDLQFEAKLRTDRPSFTLYFRPVDKVAKSVRGRLDYSTP